MAVAAFKSTSKRGNFARQDGTWNDISAKENTEDLGNKVAHRRSRSVSAVSRNHSETSSSSLNQVDYLNKRDNPLFCSSNLSSPDDFESGNVSRIAKFGKITPKFGETAPTVGGTATKLTGSSATDGRRSRSVSRSSEIRPNLGVGLAENDPRRGRSACRNQMNASKELGRSLSRVDMGRRRRSVSRSHYGTSESDIEQEHTLAASSRIKNTGNLALSGQRQAILTNASELSKQAKSLQTWSSQHPLSEPSSCSTPCLQVLDWEDGISASSYSEAGERTIKAVFEQRKSDHVAGDAKSGGIYETVRSEVQRVISEIRHDLENAIQRKNSTIISAANISDISPDLVNPDAIELISDIRREYATKLEQSQERARALRANLAVEEQRGKELSRILKEILPDPKNSEPEKSRPKRKTSIERRKMSRRLEEEAMSYFDECVSISTFDSSDFSSPEDPAHGSVAPNPAKGGSRFYPDRDSSVTMASCSEAHLNLTKGSDNKAQSWSSHKGHESTATSSIVETDQKLKNDKGGNLANDHTHNPRIERDGFHDIRNYVKIFERESKKDDMGYREIPSSYCADDYDWRVSSECLLFEKVILKNRINSGGLLLCGVGIN